LRSELLLLLRGLNGIFVFFIIMFSTYISFDVSFSLRTLLSVHLYLIPSVSQVVDIDSSQLLRGIGSDEPPAQVGPTVLI
jgi:hypothetical protein